MKRIPVILLLIAVCIAVPSIDVSALGPHTLSAAATAGPAIAAPTPEPPVTATPAPETAASDPAHPRLFLRMGEEKALVANIGQDSIWTRMHRAIVAECDTICGLPPAQRVVVGPRLHATSCEILRRVLFLSYAYRTTGELKYADRAEQEMLYVAGYQDWHPKHFLDVAEIAAAFAIGYDWLYDRLAPSSRETILKALKEKALDPAEDPKYNYVFTTAESRKCNWGQVCNSGITLAAIATLSENPEQSSRLIDRCSEVMLDPMIAGYPPMGCFREGFGYWAFGTQYNILFIDAMEKYFGPESVARHKAVKGFVASGNYSQQLITPSLRTFGYSDNSTRIYLEPAVMWFNSQKEDPAMYYRQKALFEQFERTRSYVKTIKNRLIPFMLIWGAGTGDRPRVSMDNAQEPQSRFYHGRGDNEICVMRSGWKSDDAYLGFKAGSPKAPHGHMDVGSFYYELDGVRWSLDLGSDVYESIETNGVRLFGSAQGADRWHKLTRYNNFAHSTTYPEGTHQKVEANCVIKADARNMRAESDLSALYPGKVRSLKRTISLAGKCDTAEEPAPPHRGSHGAPKCVTVQDRVTAGPDSVEMVWNMTTEALSLERDGSVLVLRAKGGRVLRLAVTCDRPFTAALESAAPKNSFEDPNAGISFLRLRYTVPAGESTTLKVAMTPGENEPETDHPRLILKAGQEAALKANIKSDARWTKMHERVIAEARELLREPLPQYRLGVRKEMHTLCCETVRQALYSSYAWRMTGDRRFLDKAEALALNFCSLDSWNPYHFLDVAEMTVAASFIYDWCYDALKPSTRKALAESIRDKALIPSETGGSGNPKYNLRWMDMTNNWSQICHGSMAIGAIALYGEENAVAQRILKRTAEKTRIPMEAEYPPMGAYSQGIGYWGYGTMLSALYLDAMDRYFGEESTSGLKDIPGFMQTGTYYSQLISNLGDNFSFADNSTSPVMPEHCTFWFYEKTGDPGILYFQKQLIDRYQDDSTLTKGSYGRHLPLMVVWGAGTGREVAADFSRAVRPSSLFYIAEGINPVCTMRSGWDSHDWWIGVKAGNPSSAHGHMDIGEFLFEYGGVRFGTDLGSDGYADIARLGKGSLFKMGGDAVRWNHLLRYNNFSHSTLTVNGAFQTLGAKSGFSSYSDDPQNMYVTADLTPSYAEELASLTRKVSLVGKREMVVQDEIRALDSKDAEVVWNLTTNLDSFSFDSKKGEGIITVRGVSMKMQIETALKYTVSEEKVNGCFKYPAAEKKADGVSFVRVRFKVEKGRSAGFTCRFIPVEANPDRRELLKMMDVAFRKAAKCYPALADSISKAAPGKIPHSIRDGKVYAVGPWSWTSGFFPGNLWYIYEYTRNPRIKARAEAFTSLLESQRHNSGTHDIGFMIHCSYGNSWRIEPSDEKRQVILDASDALCSRFNPVAGVIRSWDKEVRPGWHYPVIIDNMMNLEMLLWAWRQTGDEKYLNVARTHALTTMKNHFRPDASSYHVVNYDPVTGKPVFRGTFQGLADTSSWARGQGWGLYGNTVMYRYTGEKVFLEQAEKIASYIMNHPSMPEDKVPLWDYCAPPDAPRDASAAALYASALLELSTLTESGWLSGRYFDYAVGILKSLSSDAYTAGFGENGGFLLKHSVTAFPLGVEIDQPLNYADYYYFEALLRLKHILENDK